jgi:hypothetical protein
MKNEINPKMETEMQIAKDLVNLCQWPEINFMDRKVIKKSFQHVVKDDIDRLKNELFVLLYIAVFEVLNGLSEKFTEKYQYEQNPEYSLAAVKLVTIKSLFQIGWEYLAEKRGIVNPEEKLVDRFTKYSEALKMIAVSTTYLNKLFTPFYDCCGEVISHAECNNPLFAFTIYIPDIFFKTMKDADNLIKQGLNLPQIEWING